MLKALNYLLYIPILIVFFLSPQKILAQEYFFQEEFNQERPNNTLDNSKWIVYPNANPNWTSLRETNGTLVTVQQQNTKQYPLIVSKNEIFPNGDFSVEIKFQYIKVTYWGTGIVLSDKQVENGGGFDALISFAAWQDKSLANMRLQYGNTIIDASPVNTDQHVFRVDRVGLKYKIYLDGELVFTSPETNYRVKYLWMGNPVVVNPYIPEWTRFNVDYIRVTDNSPKASEPFLELPWDYKGEGLSFNEAGLAINSFFDHEYPLLSSGLGEPEESLNNLTNYEGKFRGDFDYSSHDGYDYGLRAGVRLGTPVLAAESGIATYHSPAECPACGHAIYIDHPNGYQSRYYHLQLDGLITGNTVTKVNVAKGQKIGLVGMSGNTDGPHIHFMVILDKNGDGNFEDNIPDGLVDPFGWQSTDSDPWENYAFYYSGQERKGSKSFYLWKEKLDSLNANLSANSAVFETERYRLEFPENSTDQNLGITIKSSPVSQSSEFLRSFGSVIQAHATDALGNIVTQFSKYFRLTIDFSGFDLSFFNKDTIAIYSSEDGVNWNKEETILDFENMKATAMVNHFSYFALMGERADTAAPITNATIIGEEGEAGWFRTDVSVLLSAADNEGGVGVGYTFYSLDGGELLEYTEPIKVLEEGNHKIDYYSIDRDENIEAKKSLEFNIDKTNPEAKIFIDPNAPDLVVEGIDENETSVEKSENLSSKNKNDLIYTVADLAGNELVLDVREFDKEKKDKLKVFSMRYNDGEIFYIPDALFNVKYKGKKEEELEISEQNFKLKGEVKIIIKYNPEKDKSTIILKEKDKEKVKELSDGIILLQLLTNKGNLEYSY